MSRGVGPASRVGRALCQTGSWGHAFARLLTLAVSAMMQVARRSPRSSSAPAIAAKLFQSFPPKFTLLI